MRVLKSACFGSAYTEGAEEKLEFGFIGQAASSI